VAGRQAGVIAKWLPLIVVVCVPIPLGAVAARSAAIRIEMALRKTGSCPSSLRPPPYRVGGAYVGNFAVGGVDANGCNSLPYELVSPLPGSFFAGRGFKPGVVAYEFGTRETTELIGGRQLIRVVDPTHAWVSAYSGFDSCVHQSAAVVCTAPAVRARPTNWWWLIVALVALGLFVVIMIHLMRPAGPIRRRRHFGRAHEALSSAVSRDGAPDLTPKELARLRRRLRRLEAFLSSDLSESQHRWFTRHVASGRHGMALESLARWFAETKVPMPEELREEFDWLASSLGIEHLVLPVIERPTWDDLTHVPAPGDADHGGFDVPIDKFRRLVGESLDSLPEQFRRAMANVAITVEEESEDGRLGEYFGVPLTKRRHLQWTVSPDKITIFRRNVCACSRSEAEVRAYVHMVVLHEIAHHFGIGDARLKELGWG
jgi:predicted Zn-dependent protease with MMP-like domain